MFERKPFSVALHGKNVCLCISKNVNYEYAEILQIIIHSMNFYNRKELLIKSFVEEKINNKLRNSNLYYSKLIRIIKIIL